MIIILGLVILVAAVAAGVGGVLANSGSGHALTHGFAVFGYHVTGSTGTLFLYGIVVGAVGVLGLSLLLAGARRTSRRGRDARRGLKQSRRETAAAGAARDDLIDQREAARAYTASNLGNGTPAVATSRPRAAAAGAGCTCPGVGPRPRRPRAPTRNRGTASPPPMPRPVRPPQQMTHGKRTAGHEYRQEDHVQGRSS